MIITISGMHGAGNSSVSRMLAKELGYRYIYVGQIMRQIAKDKNVSLEELGKIAEKERWVDEEIDKNQKELRTKDNIVLDAKIGFYFIPNSFKVRLIVDENTAIERVIGDIKKSKRKNEFKQDEIGNLSEIKLKEKVKKELSRRLKSEKKRYLKYYGVDLTNNSNFDLVIDTSNKSIKKVKNIILNSIKKHKRYKKRDKKERKKSVKRKMQIKK